MTAEIRPHSAPNFNGRIHLLVYFLMSIKYFDYSSKIDLKTIRYQIKVTTKAIQKTNCGSYT